jgi:hypothetical protein
MDVTALAEPDHVAIPYKSPDERRAEGKALRDGAPREDRGSWKPPKNRRDPVDILNESNEGRETGNNGRHFYVRQLRDMKTSAIIEDFEAADLRAYSRVCGWAPARAHARSGDAAMIAGYMGSSEIFDAAMREFAVDYADQAQRDHRAFVKAVRQGRLKAVVDA